MSSQTTSISSGIAPSHQLRGRALLEFDLRQMLLDGLTDYSRPLSTETELSERYGICRNTVRKVLQVLTDEGYLYKRHGLGTYAYSPEERGLTSKIQLKYLVFIPEYTGNISQQNPYDKKLISGISDYVFQHSGRIFSRKYEGTSSQLFEQYRNLKFDGIIWERPDQQYYPVIRELHQLHVPQVTISRQLEGIPSLFFDYRQGITDTLKFLCSICHNQIAFLDLDRTNPIFLNRRRVFAENISRILNCDGGDYIYTEAFNRCPDRILSKILTDHSSLTALFCSSALLPNLWQVLKQKKINIPEDLTLISFGEINYDFPEKSYVSTLNEPRFDIGWRAAEILKCIINGEKICTDPEYVPGELTIRKSCTAPRKILETYNLTI